MKYFSLTENSCLPIAAKMNMIIPKIAVRFASEPSVDTMIDNKTRIVFHDWASLKTRIWCSWEGEKFCGLGAKWRQDFGRIMAGKVGEYCWLVVEM